MAKKAKNVELKCITTECRRMRYRRGWCGPHYHQLRKSKALPPLVELSVPEKFWARVEITETCWLWIGALTSEGYGNFISGPHEWSLAHRYAYEFCVGPIPEGLTIDHLCRIRRCVLPDHLEPVTNRVNILRGESPSARQARQTHCIYGHPFDEENTWLSKTNKRHCRTCNRNNQRVLRARRRAA